MVTVSNNLMNYVNNPAAVGSFSASETSTKQYIDKNFQAQNSKENNRIYKKDTLLDDTFSEKMRVNWEKTKAIPLKHFPRGLGGAQDYTFFEFLQTAKFPYYVGGPILAALFYAGVNKNNFQAAKAAKTVAKHMALGVGLYYVGAAIAKSIVNTTVRLTRGIDLNQPYARAIPTSTNHTGVFGKDTEYHKVFESADFTRWDLLYNHEGKTPEEINEKYIKLAKKYGIKEDANDVDSTVKPLVKKTIIMARAWQYALTACYVALGIGMANQTPWKNESLAGFKRTVKDGIFGINKTPLKQRLHNAKIAVYDYALKPFGKSFTEFWKGHNKASSIAGKSIITLTGLATLTAISLLIGKTSGRNHKIVKKDEKTNEVQK